MCDTKRLTKLRLVSVVKRYGFDLLGCLNSASRAFFHPEIASESNFDLESHLVLF